MADCEPVVETSLDLNQGLPPIIADLINSGRIFLGLDPAWHIYIKMNDKPAGSDQNAASTLAFPVYYNAHLNFAPCVEVEASNIRVQYILHELLHVSLAELDEVIEEMIACLPRQIRKVLKHKYQDEVERFIQRTVRGITDNPGILQEYAATFQEKSDSQR
jgi:hypothetical protein